jgi:hypothetical protein
LGVDVLVVELHGDDVVLRQLRDPVEVETQFRVVPYVEVEAAVVRSLGDFESLVDGPDLGFDGEEL